MHLPRTLIQTREQFFPDEKLLPSRQIGVTAERGCPVLGLMQEVSNTGIKSFSSLHPQNQQHCRRCGLVKRRTASSKAVLVHGEGCRCSTLCISESGHCPWVQSPMRLDIRLWLLR